MLKFIIFNTVYCDGVGDFAHFSDIIKALRANAKFNDVEFLAIVEFTDGGSDTNYRRIQQQLIDLNIPFFYGKREDHERYYLEKTVQKQLSEADQAIIISADFGLAHLYKRILRTNIPLKTILEHEVGGMGWTRSRSDPDVKLCSDANLGLSHKKSGIKIENVELIEPDQAWKILEKHDHNFTSCLLSNLECPDFTTLFAQNIFVPAYFTIPQAFNSFVHFIGSNKSVSPDKNIVMHVSGPGCKIDEKTLMPLLKLSTCKQLIVFSFDKTTQVFDANPDGKNTIQIMQGFYLKEPSYSALFQLARGSIAGVSGDNSFERCVSMNVLPFYWSTNAGDKVKSLDALKDISLLSDINIPKTARDSYNQFFDKYRYFDFACYTGFNVKSSPKIPDSDLNELEYLNINVQEMIKYWPEITAYLRQEKNFYNQLESFMLEGLPLEAFPVNNPGPTFS